MKCPFCAYKDDRVLDTRVHKNGEVIRRRRECLSCKSRFTTQEILILAYPSIVKKDGRREDYSKHKIQKGIQMACQKRPVPMATIDQIVEKISHWALEHQDKEITTDEIGQQVSDQLKSLDDVAYVRFASVYKTFKDVHEFVETLNSNKQSLTPPQ